MIDSLHYYFPPGGAGLVVYYKSINFSILVLSSMYTNYHIVAIQCVIIISAVVEMSW